MRLSSVYLAFTIAFCFVRRNFLNENSNIITFLPQPRFSSYFKEVVELNALLICFVMVLTLPILSFAC